jgi:hypothetical protein
VDIQVQQKLFVIVLRLFLFGEAPMFIWNTNIGLGFVSKTDVFASPKANVWLWRAARYQRAIYSLIYWRGITDCEQGAVVQLEELAFG